jgi:tripartite-type tricarboxylate transporter receptor subunit TctC
LLLLALVTGFGANWSSGQNYPTKPIRIVTANIGGSSDFVARLLGSELSTSLGQGVVIENRPTGPVLAMVVAKAPPDGYTLMMWGAGLWIGPLFGEAPYDVVRDFAPIAVITRSPSLFVVHPSLPVRSVAELIKLAKSRPGELNYSSGSNGSGTHIAGALLTSMANLDIVRIRYSGSSEISDLLTGQVHLGFGSGTSLASLIRAGKLRALATAGSRRSVLFPDLPTVSETLPGFIQESVNAFWAPAKTPDAIIRRLNQESARALEKPEFRERVLKNGSEVAGGTPDQLADLFKSDLARTRKIISETGIKAGG